MSRILVPMDGSEHAEAALEPLTGTDRGEWLAPATQPPDRPSHQLKLTVRAGVFVSEG